MIPSLAPRGRAREGGRTVAKYAANFSFTTLDGLPLSPDVLLQELARLECGRMLDGVDLGVGDA